MEFADKIIISNYDYPKGSSGVIPVSPLVWIQENFDFYCEVYSKAKLVPKLIMVVFINNSRHCHYMATTLHFLANTTHWRPAS